MLNLTCGFLFQSFNDNKVILHYCRATANVELEDATGVLIASAIGNPAEVLLKHDAESLMNSDVNIEELLQSETREEQIFYLKVTQLEPNTVEYKYEVVFVLDAYSAITDATEETSDKNRNSSYLSDDNNSDIQDISPPSAKRSLCQPSAELVVSNIDALPENVTFNPQNAEVSGKGKLD